jgi:hypothetical protein
MTNSACGAALRARTTDHGWRAKKSSEGSISWWYNCDVGSLGKSHSNSIWTLLICCHHGAEKQHDIYVYFLYTNPSKLTNRRGRTWLFRPRALLLCWQRVRRWRSSYEYVVSKLVYARILSGCLRLRHLILLRPSSGCSVFRLGQPPTNEYDSSCICEQLRAKRYMIAFVELDNGVLYWMPVGCVPQKVYLVLPKTSACAAIRTQRSQRTIAL